MEQKNVLREKLNEAVHSVLPVTVIVALVCLFAVPMDNGLVLSFILGSLMLIAGMGLFTLGSDMAMTRIGGHIGSSLTRSKKLWLIVAVSFALGAAITMAEPDLQVLSRNVPDIDKTVLTVTVSVGVGIFLALCMVRILLSISLRALLIALYAAVFVLAAFSDTSVLSVAFDAGGVTTGPMTVPFIMALGVGVASIRSDKRSKEDSFGLVALCSVGPILAVMVLSLIFPSSGSSENDIVGAIPAHSVELGMSYVKNIPAYMWEVSLALLPIFVFFLLFQLISLKLAGRSLKSILFGILCTYIGLVLFLTGVNVGFSPLGYSLGSSMASGPLKVLLIPLSMLMGWYIISAEPAVHVLTRQVEELTAGAISRRAIGMSLSVAVCAANGLAMLRVLTGIPIMYFLVPGYLISVALSFLVPPTFTAIAFDSGGVASGPLTATFMLPFAMGACSAVGGNMMTDAFGLVALVAMMPLITVQVLGALYTVRAAGKSRELPHAFADDEIIELWEVG